MSALPKLIVASAVLLLAFAGDADAQALNCSSAYQISQTFENGARWEMCWERRNREGIVYHDVHYTTVDGTRRRVLAEAALAQIHVPYDDNGARYHDVSDYGLGTSSYLNNLSSGDCPDGFRIIEGSKHVICRTLVSGEVASVAGATVTSGETMRLFSVSHVGAYNYIPEWRFLDDGTIEVAMGATGRLQRYTSNAAYGWPVRDASSSYGVSHLHNYYWRLDFDLGTSATDDIVEEIEFVGGPGTTQERLVTAFSTETKRSIEPTTQRFWRVRDGSDVNADGLPISYEIVATDTGHRDTGPRFRALDIR